jgi:gliding motility-associated-like protein
MRKLKIVLGAIFLLSGTFSNAQIIVQNNVQTPTDLVTNVLAGTGVTISNVTFNTSVPLANAVQTQVGYFDATGTTFPIIEGLVMGTGDVQLAIGPNDSPGSTDNNGVATDPNDPDLALISPFVMNNEAILEFDFIPSGDSIVFNYIFASEEYHEYSTSNFNDAFGFFISGPGFAGPYTNGAENIAVVPGTTLPVTMNNLNNGLSNTGPCVNCAYLVDNPTGSPDVQYDGHTVTLQAAASVICGEVYHIKLAIGDAGDTALDSGVFLEANSFSSNGVNVTIASATGSAAITEACDSAIVTFVRPEDADTSVLNITYTIGGTATNGTDYPFLDGNVTFNIGEDSVQFYVTPSADGLTEGTETVEITVEIVNQCGDTIVTTATIEIIDPVPYNVLTTDIDIDCPQTTVDVTATTDGGIPQLTYDWGIYGTGQTVQVPGDIVGTTTYTVDVLDECGQPSTGTIDVTLTPAPEPTINFNQNTFTICPGEVADIDATVNNPYDPGNITYDWQPTNETTEDISVSPTVLTWYYLTINDGCYDVIDSVKVDMADLTLTNIAITDATNCPGQPGTPGAIDVLPNDPTWTYTLIGGGNTVGPQTNGNFAGLDGGVTYFLNVVNADGCSVDTAVTVGLGANAVTATFVLDSLRDVTCFGDADGGAYVIDLAGGITPPYDVTWTHTSGLHDTDAALGAGGTSEQDNLFGGSWVVTVTDQEGCAWSTLFDVFEPGDMILDWTFNDPSCYQFTDGSVSVNTDGGNGGNTFLIWENNAGDFANNINPGNTTAANNLGTGWYYASIEDSKGCFVMDSVFLDEPGELAIDLNVEQPLCYGFPTGYVEVTDVYNYTGDVDSIGYFWNPNPSAIPNGIGSSFINHLGPGPYSLTINDENGCSKVFDFTIAYPPEMIFTELGTEPAYCRTASYQSGNGVVFAAAGGGTPDFDYLWTNLGTGQTTTNTTWGGRNPGEYQIIVLDNNGCALIDTVTLDSLNPIADFDVESPQFLTDGVYEGTAEVCITFTNTSQHFSNINDPNADTTFFWNFNYDTTAWTITHDFFQTYDTCYTSEGEYEVCLIAVNKNDCKDTTCKTMIIHDPLDFQPVNIFTPNNDGDNDVFTFAYWAQAVASFECTIVDRWGVTVHVMTDINDEWDGTNMSGNACPDGIYYYTYSGVATDSTVFSGQGFVYIIGSL